MQNIKNGQALGDLNLNTIENLLINMKYGSITLIVQDGKVIQIDKTEKYRVKN